MKILIEDCNGRDKKVEIPHMLRLTFHDSSALWDAVSKMELPDELVDIDIVDFYREKLEEWIEFGDDITVEIDLKKKKARIIKVAESKGV